MFTWSRRIATWKSAFGSMGCCNQGVVEPELAPNLVRLKVLAELLTYRVDIPQEEHSPRSE